MKTFYDMLVADPPRAYYILISSEKTDGQWRRIDPMITQEYVYFPEGFVAVYSSPEIAREQQKGKLLELLCLSCFYHILRMTMKLRFSIIDNRFRVQIKPWRAPCESAAVITDTDGKVYYLEGCREIGVFWRWAEEIPKTTPPFISCGALDQNAGCWGEDCPHGYYFQDEEEPFTRAT